MKHSIEAKASVLNCLLFDINNHIDYICDELKDNSSFAVGSPDYNREVKQLTKEELDLFYTMYAEIECRLNELK